MSVWLIRILNILASIALLVVLYLVTIWVLGMLGISVPSQILTAIFVFLGLIMAIGVLTGRLDNWWTR